MSIVEDLGELSHVSIINGMDFCVDLPNEFFDNCPQWTETDLQNSFFQELDEESYCIDANRGCYGIGCDRRYVPGAWNGTLYPNSLSLTNLSCIKKAKPRINGLLDDLSYTRTDIAFGILPLNNIELIQYKRSLKI